MHLTRETYKISNYDTSAPTEWARLIWKQNQESALVIRHGDDHVSLQRKFNARVVDSGILVQELIDLCTVNTPSSSISKEFIRTGVLPDSQNSSLVTVYRTGMEVAPIASPYDYPTGAIAGDVDSA
jgi:hypothetical protein